MTSKPAPIASNPTEGPERTPASTGAGEPAMTGERVEDAKRIGDARSPLAEDAREDRVDMSQVMVEIGQGVDLLSA